MPSRLALGVRVWNGIPWGFLPVTITGTLSELQTQDSFTTNQIQILGRQRGAGTEVVRRLRRFWESLGATATACWSNRAFRSPEPLSSTFLSGRGGGGPSKQSKQNSVDKPFPFAARPRPPPPPPPHHHTEMTKTEVFIFSGAKVNPPLITTGSFFSRRRHSSQMPLTAC